jgi:hypothetical protein
VVIPQFAMKKQFSWINSLQMGLGFHSYVQWPEGISTTTKDLIRWNWNPQQCSLSFQRGCWASTLTQHSSLVLVNGLRRHPPKWSCSHGGWPPSCQLRQSLQRKMTLHDEW